MRSIRCQGIYNKTWEIIGFFGRNGLARANKLEMTFKDNSSWSMELQIDRTELDEIVNLIKKLNKTKPNNGEHP